MLGQGTYGQVWKVNQNRCRKQLTIDDPDERRRHFEEYHTLCRLVHPNIVPVLGYDSGQSGRLPSFEMPMLGLDVGKLIQIQRGQCPLLDTRQLGDLQSAIMLLVEMKLVHLDIKPENVLIHGTKLVLCDFGLSAKEGEIIYREEKITPGYWPPEFMGDKLRACTSLDVFALGVVALEMVLRRRLYAEFKACAGSVICMQLVRDRLLREVADADMRGAIAAMLEIDVRQRHMNLVTRRRHSAAICSAGAQ